MGTSRRVSQSFSSGGEFRDLRAEGRDADLCRARKLCVRGMGAAIPLAMGVALAVKEEVGGTLEVRTGSETVTDEITPDDEVSSALGLRSRSRVI